MRRVVPPGGLVLHGYFLPPKTIVSSNAYCLHRNEDVFPRPFEWIPERWLSVASIEDAGFGARDSSKMRKWLWAFGSGPRGCIGQHFALQSRPYDPGSALMWDELTGSSHQARCGNGLLQVHYGDRRRRRHRAVRLVQLWADWSQACLAFRACETQVAK